MDQIEMQDHSKAKVQLYGTYLSRYLRILVQKNFTICIFDLFCGEGMDKNGNLGSPLVAIEQIENILTDHPETTSEIHLWFNDLEMSSIEKNVPKVKRVERFFLQSALAKHPHVFPHFYQQDYQINLREAIKFFELQKYAKGLFFIDPCGYKYIHAGDLRSIR